MSLLGVHAGFAATITAVLVADTTLTRPQRWTVIAVSAFWAIIPDAYHVIPAIRSWYKPLIHDSIIANVFWFHQAFDRLNPSDQPIFSVIMMTIFLTTVFLTEVRGYRLSYLFSKA